MSTRKPMKRNVAICDGCGSRIERPEFAPMIRYFDGDRGEQRLLYCSGACLYEDVSCDWEEPTTW